jgi:IS5 family transposase
LENYLTARSFANIIIEGYLQVLLVGSSFSKQEKRARYRGRTKVQLQAFMDSIAHNIKRLVVINKPNFCIC